MPFRGTTFDREFLRQAVAEKRLSDAQLNEIMGAQDGQRDRGIHRAIPIIAHELGLLTRPLVEQIIRHVLRRIGPVRIGNYKIIQQIGRGGMGVVYQAVQMRMRRTIALKLLIRRDMSEKFINRFKREGHACAQLRHQNLVAAFEVGHADGWHYFAMELVDGPTVNNMVRENGAFSDLEGVRLVRQVAEALQCAHEHGIIHRDIKPGNIMITSSGDAKLCDLGLARIHNVDESELYEPGTTLGSRRYMSPEQACGLGRIDARSDIYSLGLTLFYMLTGVPPFSDVPKDQVMAEHIRGVLEWPADVNPSISDEACKMIWHMSSKDPERRPQSARELVGELRLLEKDLMLAMELAPDRLQEIGSAAAPAALASHDTDEDSDTEEAAAQPDDALPKT